ncbi:peptidoglycan DD-metalloendopeptidase family protein [Comamonadaceae bacterium BS-T2-15]|uniref:Peptidoglycan DD-metalloendopeptidase family protein n=1 Tax=Scleromatobacter humisilvae TaxID=2897159 RepID=A0A9X1YHV0_9BURK|nr:peptidoglycan DD-metalloendopeptidase family protein [Scleromatobacter humisilvae]MCK9686784.1 peptidoglycan DD-metalloendopeptidase family protein [Scleromatobacter humisilvae]
MTTVCVASAWALIGCATPNQAPVEDHSARTARPVVPVVETKPTAATPVPAAEGRAGTYTVQPGDMLTKIGMDTGQSWRDLARWNNLADPNHLEVGQVLRVMPPAGDVAPGSTVTTTTTTTTVGAASAATFKPLPPIPAKASGAAATPSSAPATASAVPLTGVATPQPAVREGDDDLTWAWPAAGPVVAPFDDAKTKGLAIGGKAGDPVYAAADGRVVYAGSGLRGYGNLVIVKHNANYLTAYAHNQALLVKEDQIVKRGQKIAEMGSTDADRVQLHFEIRKQGKPIDPSRLLPPR